MKPPMDAPLKPAAEAGKCDGKNMEKYFPVLWQRLDKSTTFLYN
ncbi:hypothetical protein ACTQ50_16655 [Blautia sp. Sow4_E7]